MKVAPVGGAAVLCRRCYASLAAPLACRNRAHFVDSDAAGVYDSQITVPPARYYTPLPVRRRSGAPRLATAKARRRIARSQPPVRRRAGGLGAASLAAAKARRRIARVTGKARIWRDRDLAGTRKARRRSEFALWACTASLARARTRSCSRCMAACIGRVSKVRLVDRWHAA